MNIHANGCAAETESYRLFFYSSQLILLRFIPLSRGHPRFVGHASFLLDELLYSVGPDNGSDQVPLVGPGILLLHCLLSPARMAE